LAAHECRQPSERLTSRDRKRISVDSPKIGQKSFFYVKFALNIRPSDPHSAANNVTDATLRPVDALVDLDNGGRVTALLMFGAFLRCDGEWCAKFFSPTAPAARRAEPDVGWVT
jgi:hypothetical protein